MEAGHRLDQYTIYKKKKKKLWKADKCICYMYESEKKKTFTKLIKKHTILFTVNFILFLFFYTKYRHKWCSSDDLQKFRFNLEYFVLLDIFT